MRVAGQCGEPEGPSRELLLIVQDGGLRYHARTMGFAFLE